MVQEDISQVKASNSLSLHQSIHNNESEESIVSILEELKNLDEIWVNDEHGRNPLQILHRKYYVSVFEIAFHSKNSINTPLLHDEWFTNPDWKYTATIASRIISKVVNLENICSTNVDDHSEERPSKKIKNPSYLLHEALRMNSNQCPVDIIRLLITSPFQNMDRGIDSKDESGNLPLHLAIDNLAAKLMNYHELEGEGEEKNQDDLVQHKDLVLDLLDLYPASGTIPNDLGEFPIQKLTHVSCKSELPCVPNVLDPLWKHLLPTKEFIRSLYCNSDESLTRSKKNLHLLLLSMGETTRQVDIFFQIFRQVPWILQPQTR